MDSNWVYEQLMGTEEAVDKNDTSINLSYYNLGDIGLN